MNRSILVYLQKYNVSYNDHAYLMQIAELEFVIKSKLQSHIVKTILGSKQFKGIPRCFNKYDIPCSLQQLNFITINVFTRADMYNKI